MNDVDREGGPSSQPPVRHLRLLATLWLPAAVLTGLVALGAARMAVSSVMGLVVEPDVPVAVHAAGLLVGGLAAVVLGRISWCLAIEVPRHVKAWEAALEDRLRALRA